MNAPRPHHLSAEHVDTLPCDLAVEQAGGLVDIWLDTNHPVWQRIRLDSTNAVKLHRALGALITTMQIRLKDIQL